MPATPRPTFWESHSELEPTVPVSELRALLAQWETERAHWDRNAQAIDRGERPGDAERLRYRARGMSGPIDDLADLIGRDSPQTKEEHQP